MNRIEIIMGNRQDVNTNSTVAYHIQPVRTMLRVSSIVTITNIDSNDLHDCVEKTR